MTFKSMLFIFAHYVLISKVDKLLLHDKQMCLPGTMIQAYK